MRHLRVSIILSLTVALIMIMAACTDNDPDTTPDETDEEQTPMTFDITSAAFDATQTIPDRYTCTSDDVSPPLTFTGHPDNTASIALIVDDPDAPGSTWVHWVVMDLPGDTAMIPEAVTSNGDLPGNALQGQNSWGRSDYGGPCPPSGEHRYYFKAYALDTQLDLDASATKADVETAMDGHILAQAQLMGIYQQ